MDMVYGAQPLHLRRSALARNALVAVPAAIVTLSLFAAMRALITVETFEPPAQTAYVLTPYMEVIDKPEPDPVTRKPKRPAEIDPPPNVPVQTRIRTKVSTPVGDYTGAAPTEYGKRRFQDLLPKVVGHIPERTILPITPPVPIYPSKALERGLEGDCDVYFSVSPRGEPFEAEPRCSDRVFERAARNAILKVKFAPQIRNGSPVTVRGVVYPLEFRLKP